MAESNPILQAAKRVPAQVILAPADLLNMVLGLVSGKGLSGVTPKSPSETINQDVFGLAEPDLLSVQGAAELAAGLVSPAKGIAAVAKAAGVAAPALVSLMERAPALQKILNKEAGIIGGKKFAENINISDVMQLAEDMYVSGKSQHYIAQATSKELASRRNPGQAMSVFMGPDGKPRLVVGNDYSSVVPERQIASGEVAIPRLRKGEEINLSDILLHPSLYEGSDLARTAKVKLNPELESGSARYVSDTNTIELAKSFGIPSELKNDPEELLGLVLRHEVGHAIQVEEGHRLGTSPTTAGLLKEVTSAIDTGSFKEAPILYDMQQRLAKDLPLSELADIVREDSRLQDYVTNYGEWEAEFGAKMNSRAFPMMHERKKTW